MLMWFVHLIIKLIINCLEYENADWVCRLLNFALHSIDLKQKNS